MLGVSSFWTWILQRLKHRFSFTHCMGFHYFNNCKHWEAQGLTDKLEISLHYLFKKDPIYLESPFASGGVGVVNLLQLHYTMIIPTERKQQEEKK